MNTTLYFVQDNRTLITVKVSLFDFLGLRIEVAKTVQVGEIALGCRLVQIDVRINDALVVKVGSLLFLGQLANTIQVSETGSAFVQILFELHDRPTVWHTSDSMITIVCSKARQGVEDTEEDAMLVD
ncbi:hypothetical protein C8R46DRAFT_1229035 [Mycena filopes]|nr:hypothetical protein C8R46DRAFT_1229035 [Mycena filopes]